LATGLIAQGNADKAASEVLFKQSVFLSPSADLYVRFEHFGPSSNSPA
jgi:hypothetical protein